jgi:hypothetical protein
VGLFKVKEPLGPYSSSKVTKGTVSYTLSFWTFSLKVSSLHIFKGLIFPSSLFHLLTFWSLTPMKEARLVEVQ